MTETNQTLVERAEELCGVCETLFEQEKDAGDPDVRVALDDVWDVVEELFWRASWSLQEGDKGEAHYLSEAGFNVLYWADELAPVDYVPKVRRGAEAALARYERLVRKYGHPAAD